MRRLKGWERRTGRCYRKTSGLGRKPGYTGLRYFRLATASNHSFKCTSHTVRAPLIAAHNDPKIASCNAKIVENFENYFLKTKAKT